MYLGFFLAIRGDIWSLLNVSMNMVMLWLLWSRFELGALSLYALSSSCNGFRICMDEWRLQLELSVGVQYSIVRQEKEESRYSLLCAAR